MYERLRCALLLFSVAAVQLLSASSQPPSPELTFDVARVPFSRFGSYLSISRYGDRLMLRSVHGGSSSPDIFRVLLARNGQPVSFNETATPTLLTLRPTEGYGSVEILMSEPKLLRIRGRGVALRLERPVGGTQYAFRRGESQWVVNSSAQDLKVLLTPVTGRLSVDPLWTGTGSRELVAEALPDASGNFEIVLEEFTGSWHEQSYPESFEAALARVQKEYGSWLRSMPSVPPELRPAAELAAYVNWSAVVGAEGNFRAPAMLMSKNWMAQMWTWDHCFNAMALVKAQPALAWQQFFAPFNVQNADGALPDSMTDRNALWAYSKPPIHGWALRWMMHHGTLLSHADLARTYSALSAWTDWYFRFRDDDRDGLPEYQHGNDSGWDNSTVFLKGVPVESPDLAAFLVLQMDELSELAQRLGKSSESRSWKRRSDYLLQQMIARMWRGDHFVALSEGEHDSVIESGSLLLYIPLVLGKRLPPEVASKMIERLRENGRFLTDNGLATESPSSRYYVADGYWLGPIWAPSTMLIVSGLDDLGQRALAGEIRQRFCRMVAAGGMAENFDAVSGKPLRDPAYTWTSSVFLIFANELTSHPAEAN